MSCPKAERNEARITPLQTCAGGGEPARQSGPTSLRYAPAGDDQRVIAVSPSPRQIADLRKRLVELTRRGDATTAGG